MTYATALNKHELSSGMVRFKMTPSPGLMRAGSAFNGPANIIPIRTERNINKVLLLMQ